MAQADRIAIAAPQAGSSSMEADVVGADSSWVLIESADSHRTRASSMAIRNSTSFASSTGAPSQISDVA